MKHMLETMYIMTPDSYLFHRNDNICISIGGEEKASVPASQVASVVFFGKNSVSTSLLSFCSELGITMVFLDQYGKFYGRVCGPVSGKLLWYAEGVRGGAAALRQGCDLGDRDPGGAEGKGEISRYTLAVRDAPQRPGAGGASEDARDRERGYDPGADLQGKRRSTGNARLRPSAGQR